MIECFFIIWTLEQSVKCFEEQREINNQKKETWEKSRIVSLKWKLGLFAMIDSWGLVNFNKAIRMHSGKPVWPDQRMLGGIKCH